MRGVEPEKIKEQRKTYGASQNQILLYQKDHFFKDFWSRFKL
ncbi:hypothetical protein LEP1GSC016_1119 [Leptospira borgpetersenii serovar Hardjo-bovis str. Sponselee]|uniref:Uncharacterized protein n=1 Tax=Leptospira borgpetersenii serovar Hardjo-bovis str. Sponselee TaxID=1303729 RepID=M6BNY5_LEPBO|nr:hypothetical protein LEP1GSC016_1119 [Leptospira borgpetersenii serovar Hardjo-bovis str. Sponselee]